MTTIACTTKIMVADRKFTIGEMDRYTLVTKIKKIKGDIVGAAGDAGDCEAFWDWYDSKNKSKKPKLDTNFEGLILSKGEITWWDCTLFPIKIEYPHYAIGSSAVAVLCLMDVGKSPKESIELASKHDLLISFETDILEI
jgi:hypothetical protein